MSTTIDPSTMQPLSPYATRLEIERDDLRAENARLLALLAECASALDDGNHGRLLIRVRESLGGARPPLAGRRGEV